MTINIVIAGVSCSGKTTFANELRKLFPRIPHIPIIAQDDYFKNLSDVPRVSQGYLMDSIEAFHIEEFKQDVQTLIENGVVMMPKYDIATNTRISKNKIVRAGKINVFEGLHTIKLLGDLEHCIKFFIDTDMDTCLERRIARDTSKYGIPERRVRQYWEDCIKPMSEKFILPQKEAADFIIRRGGEFDVG